MHQSKALTPKTFRTNPGSPNVFTDLEQFEREHPAKPKTIFVTNAANHPGTGITLRTTALRVIPKAGGKPSTWLPPGGLVERSQATNTKNKH